MQTKLIRYFVFALLASLPGVVAAQFMSVDEITPGMKGVGKTVFSGTTIEPFDFEVVEIIRNFKPRRDLILVQLIGKKVEHTGVVAGMSGSPMYIDGKLIGALSYQMGFFQKEPIAGVTPIHQMLEIFAQEKSREQELAAKRGLNEDFLAVAAGTRDFDWAALLPPQLKNAPTGGTQLSLTPLEIPLFFSGFEPRMLDFSAQIFNRMGLSVLQGGGGSSVEGDQTDNELQPGSAYSVVIVDGDLGLQATGTVTYRDGDRVLGMGHPFFNSGAVKLPMGKAKILTTLSSLMASTKMASLTGVVGTVHQDRTTGVMGISGEEPQMIPVRLHFTSEFQQPVDYHFRVAEDRSLYSLTPLIFSIVLTNTLESARLSMANQTLTLEGRIQLKDHGAIELKNYYAGSRPSEFLTDGMEVAGDVAATLGALLANNFETPEIEAVELNFDVLPRKYLAIVQTVSVDKTVVRPGDQLTVSVLLKEYQGKSHVVRQRFTVPEDVSARRIAVYAGSGSTLTRLEARLAPQKYKPQSFEQLMKILNNKRKNNFVFFQLRALDKGVLVQGEEFPNLPPSVLSVMRTQKASGNISSLRDRTISEHATEVDFSVKGGRTIWLNVEKK